MILELTDLLLKRGQVILVFCFWTFLNLVGVQIQINSVCAPVETLALGAG